MGSCSRFLAPSHVIASPRLRLVRLWAVGVAGALAALAYTGAARAATIGTTKFGSPGVYVFAVPAGVRSVTVTAIGGAGGGCSEPDQPSSVGGRGALVAATLVVTPGEQLVVGAGGSGRDCPAPQGGLGGGGGGGSGGSNGVLGGPGGGGASLVGVPTPSPSFPSLLLVAGGGGGGGAELVTFGTKPGIGTFDGGASGSAGRSPFGASGGGAGTLVSAGAGGGSDGTKGAQAGTAGSFGLGGAGGGCSALSFGAGGGGGGGGYYGGGGGGCGLAFGSGGGGGSSFVAAGASNVSTALTNDPPSVSFTYLAPTADESTTAMHFATQTPGTAGPAQTLTVTNNGSAPLVISTILVGGADPDDFLIGDRCQQPVAPGANCQIGIRFHPQVAGARTATLTLLTNAATAPGPVTLTAGGTVGAPGPAGKVELLTCKPTNEKLLTHDRALAPPTTDTCTAKLVRGTADFTATGTSTRAQILRNGIVLATGASVPTAHGTTELVLTDRRPLKPGTYTLILTHHTTQRLRITLR